MAAILSRGEWVKSQHSQWRPMCVIRRRRQWYLQYWSTGGNIVLYQAIRLPVLTVIFKQKCSRRSGWLSGYNFNLHGMTMRHVEVSVSALSATHGCTARPWLLREEYIIWVRSWNCGCLVTWFFYQLIAKPGNKTATVSWPDPYE